MGGVWIWCEIVCRHCANTMGGRHISGSHIPKRKMVEEIKLSGCIIDGQDSFCDEVCHENHKRESE